MSEMKIENHFAQGAIVNNGQMNVGGGTIHVHVQGKEQRVVEVQAENATCNPQPATEDIMHYVMQLHPHHVRKEWQDRYRELWEAVLELPEVKKEIFNKGRQQNTTFNRNLVGNILHLMSERKIFVPAAHATKMAIALEGTSEHSIREQLGKMPAKEVKTAVEGVI